MNLDLSALARAALQAREHSYSPYSHFAVGAALMAQDGTVYTGCNIENASYSVSNCAERSALFAAVSSGARKFRAIAIAGGPDTETEPLPMCSPCGMCRQALFEFGGHELAVVFVQDENVYSVYTLGQLMPMGFGPASLGSFE